ARAGRRARRRASDRLASFSRSRAILAWSGDLLTIVAARGRHGTGITPRSRALAGQLAVASQELVRPGPPGAIPLQLRLQRGARRAVGRGIVLLRVPVPQASDDAQAIGLEREHGLGLGEQQDLLGSGVADAGELLQRLLGLGQRLLEHGAQPLGKLALG